MNIMIEYEIRWIEVRRAWIDRLLDAICVQEEGAAWVAGYGARGELDPIRERLLIKSDQLIDRQQYLERSLALQFG